MTVAHEDPGIRLGRGLRLAVERNGHPLAEDEDCFDLAVFNLHQRDAAADRNRTGRRVESDVFFLTDLAADVAEHPCRQRRGEVAGLLLRVVNELVDDDFRVPRDRERRLVGEQQLRLAGILGVDPLVADDVMADQQLARRLVRRRAGGIGIDRRGNTNRLLIGNGGPAQAGHSEGCKHHAVRGARYMITDTTSRNSPELGVSGSDQLSPVTY